MLIETNHTKLFVDVNEKFRTFFGRTLRLNCEIADANLRGVKSEPMEVTIRRMAGA